MKKTIQFIILFFFSIGYTQVLDVTLLVTLNNINENYPVTLESFTSKEPIEKKAVENNVFAVNRKLEPGFHRIIFNSKDNKNIYIDFIVNEQNKNLKFTFNQGQDRVPTFENSAINTSYYEYIKTYNDIKFKINVLSQFLLYYPDKNEAICIEVEKERESKLEDVKKLKEKHIKKHPNSIMSKLIEGSIDKFYLDKHADLRTQRMQYAKQYWNQDFVHSDKSMLNSPLYTTYVDTFFDLVLRNFEMEEGIDLLKKGIDRIMIIFSENIDIKQQIINQLLRHLEYVDVLKDVLQHLDEKYLDATLVEGERLKRYAFRLASYKALKKGTPAPEIIYKTENNKSLGLKDIPGDHLVIAFWESTCSHCQEQMPLLDAYAKEKNVSVLAVSIDENKASYERKSKAFKNMILYCDFKGMESSPVRNYFVVSTPTFIVLDSQRNYIERFSSIDELMAYFDKK